MSLKARLRDLEEREADRRATRAERHREMEDRIARNFDTLTRAHRDALLEMFKMWREDEAWAEEVYATFPEVPEVPGEAELAEPTLEWWVTLENLPLEAVWPDPPKGCGDYLAAALAQWEGIEARPDLTPTEATAARWEVATLRLWLAYASAMGERPHVNHG